MNFIVANFCLLVIFGCQPKSGSQKELILDSPAFEGYSLQPEDARSLDFSAPDNEPGPLEKHLLDAGLVNIKEVIPELYVELKYSTTDNFFGEDVYKDLENCYVQPVVADMLQKAHNLLKDEHPQLTFLIFDGVRPLSVQKILWDNLDKPDHIKPLYVADPGKGSLHNYGVAIDLTVVDAETGEMLDMGTGYDFFGYPAYPDREEQMLHEGKITKEQVANRKILRKAMNEAGFEGIGSEWWHFNAFSRKAAGEKFELVE
jgi:D-alanyl-D-alanine dipeptidase